MATIKHRVTGEALFESSAETMRETLIEGIRGGANLAGANLGGAYLGGAYLRGAYLGGAYLRGADLGGANLPEGFDLAAHNAATPARGTPASPSAPREWKRKQCPETESNRRHGDFQSDQTAGKRTQKPHETSACVDGVWNMRPSLAVRGFRALAWTRLRRAAELAVAS